jgi:hypothetical protein
MAFLCKIEDTRHSTPNIGPPFSIQLKNMSIGAPIGAHASFVQRRQRNAAATNAVKELSTRDAVSFNGNISLEKYSTNLVQPSSSFLDDAAPKGGTMAFEPERDSSRETWPIPASEPFRPAPKNAPTGRLIVARPRLPVVGGHMGRTGDRRSCTSMVLFLFAATLLMVDVVGAVFTPADRDALKAAVGTCSLGGTCTGGCLGERTDGFCPNFAASNDASGNPYGVIGDWDVSKVTKMDYSKCNLSPFLRSRLPLLCLFIHQLEFHLVNSHTF